MKKSKKNHLRKTTYHTILREKWREALSSVLPIVLIVLALCFVVVPVPLSTMLGFLLGMKCKESGKHFCARQLKRQAMKMVGLK